MRRLARLFLLLFFANTLSGHSMFMLSIEKGRVYAESYNLNHVLKASSSSPVRNPDNSEPVYGSGRYLSHRHIQLTQYTIPENLNALSEAVLFSSSACVPPYPAFSSSLAASFSQEQLSPGNQLKLPITPLLQSSVLLI
jgi:hypothetical protein